MCEKGKDYVVFVSLPLCGDPIGVFERLLEKGEAYTDLEDEGIEAIVNATQQTEGRCFCRFVAVRGGDYCVLYEACAESIGCDHRLEVVVECDDAATLNACLPSIDDDGCHYVSCVANEGSRSHDWSVLFADKYSRASVAKRIVDESIRVGEKCGHVTASLAVSEKRGKDDAANAVEYVRVECVFSGGGRGKPGRGTRAKIREICADCEVWLSVDGPRVFFDVPLRHVERFREGMGEISQEVNK